MNSDVQAARRAVESYPNDRSKQIDLARALIDAAWLDAGTTWKAHYEEAAAILQSIVEQEPGNAIALVNLGVALSDQGAHTQALECYRRAEKLNWLDGNLQYNIGVALANLQDDAKAVRCFEKSQGQTDHLETIRAYFDPQAHLRLGNNPPGDA